MSISEQISRLQQAKENIKNAIESKGVTVGEGTIDTYPQYIYELNSDGEMQAKTVVPSKEEQIVLPDEGYGGLSSVTVEKAPLEEKEVTPTSTGVDVSPDGQNIGLSKVKVAGDVNLTSNNIRRGVSIFGVNGNFEGNGSSAIISGGTLVSVQAQTSIYAGDRFVGIRNEDADAPEVNTIDLGLPNIIEASEDFRVAIPAQTITNNSTTIDIAFLNESGMYEVSSIPLTSDIKNTNSSVILSSGNCSINEDGTLIAICDFVDSDNVAQLLIIKPNYSSRTASTTFIEKIGMNEREGYSDYQAYATGKKDSFLVTKQYVMYCSIYNYSYTTDEGTTSSNSMRVNAIYYVGNLNHPIWSEGYSSYIPFYWGKNAVAWKDENTLFAVGLSGNSQIIRRYKINGSIFDAHYSTVLITGTSSTWSFYTSTISKNARYIGVCTNNGSKNSNISEAVYGLNPDTLEKTEINSRSYFTSIIVPKYPIYVDISGEYMASRGGVYNVSDMSAAYTAPSPSSRYFDFLNGYRSTIYKVFLFELAGNAQYLVTPTSSAITENDRVYGVAQETILRGETGKALMMFHTFSYPTPLLQNKTITPAAETQTVTADDGYEGLGTVTINGDENLTSENIKSGVSIFGVTGTM